MKTPYKPAARVCNRAGVYLAAGLSFLFSTFHPNAWAETDPKDYAVQASANVQTSPPQITLVWAPDENATGYKVHRRVVGSSTWEGGVALPGGATSWVDSELAVGGACEYQISKTTRVGYAGFGYVHAGIEAPLIEDRGKVLLLVDNLYAADLVNELARLQQDLVGDGWMVVRHDVSRTDSPANIKSLIRAEYAKDPANLRSVFLFGHVPVPYSGNFNPDGHPDHQGAWPADAYYGDMDGSWTDHSVNNTSANRPANRNVPGDGKFDQSELPSDVELEVGRVDLSNMTCFSNKTPARYEKDLLRQYLNKLHRFRHGQVTMQRRGLVCDNFGEKSGEAFAASGWRNFAAFFGAGGISAVKGWNYFSTLASESYLWSYGCGGGSYYTCNGIGSSDDFASTDIKTVFIMFLGSYFGDWDNESNFLRAPLGSTSSALAVAWAGRPHWFFHHMALGQSIGFSTRLSQNNRSGGLYSAQNHSTRGVHVALLGDPTLRMHPVRPPSELKGTVTAGGVTLSWTPSADTDLKGYHVYRADAPTGPFVRVTSGTPTAQTTFNDSSSGASNYTYMVRAIKLERSGSGTYYNPSQGIFFGPESNTSWGGSPIANLPSAPSSVIASALSASQTAVRWTDTANNELGFRIERKAGLGGSYVLAGSVGPNVLSFQDRNLAASTLYVYRVVAHNAAGTSGYSEEATVTTPDIPSVPASAWFVGADTSTQGSWSGAYGRDGYDVVGTTANHPAYANLSPIGKSDWTWAWVTTEARALQDISSPARFAAAWYSKTTFTIDLNLRDGQSHRVALYCLDWDSAARRQTIDILDARTGTVLNSQSMADFSGGVYLAWNLTGHVVIRVTRNGGENATVSGLFFDPPAPAPSTVEAPSIKPDGGTISGPTTVALASGTSGATIRYTIDGSEPANSSTTYQGPFTIAQSTTVKAKAFHAGFTESPVTTARFTLDAISSGSARALFVREDDTTQGNWRGVYGTEGYHVIGDPSAQASYPGYAEVSASSSGTFVWNDSSADRRALQRVNAASRVAGCWFKQDAFSVEVNFIDGRTHRLALYCLDWDTNAREQRVELQDAATGALLISQTISRFDGGRYLVWDIKGHVRIRFTRLSGNNAVLMGMFFGPAASQLANAGSGSLAVVSPPGNELRIRMRGQVGQRFAIQTSTDLIQWQEVRQVTLTGQEMEFTDLDALDFPSRFYRAIPVSSDSGQAGK